MNISPVVKAVGIGLFIATLLILHQFHVFDFLSLDQMRSLIDRGGIWSPLFCIAFFPLVSMLLFPNLLMILVVSILYSPGISILISSIGGLLAAYGGYCAGRWGGSDFLQKRIPERKSSEIFYVILIRFLPIPYFAQSALCGSLKIPPLKYGIGSLLELTPWILILTFLGEGFLNKNKTYLLAGFLTLALGGLIYSMIIKRRKIVHVSS